MANTVPRMANNMTLYQKLYCMIMVIILLAVLLSLKVTITPQHLHTNQQPSCKGHFHMCVMKRMIEENHLYGKHIHPQSLYNVSHLVVFKTQFFKTRKQETINFQKNKNKMHGLRAFLMEEHKSERLNKTLRFEVLNKNQSALICSFKPLEHFKYSYSDLETLTGSPPKLTFAVKERRLNTVIPHQSKYYGPALVSDVHGEVLSNMTRAACNVNDFSKGTYYIECPVLQNNVTIRLYVSYLPPSIHRYICRHNDEYLIKEFKYTDLPKVEMWKPDKHLDHLNTPHCSSRVIPRGFGFWVNLGGVWHWSTMTCHYSFSFGAKVKHCLNKRDIIMIGDSHMRNRRMSLLQYHIVNATITFSCVVSELLYHLQYAMSSKLISPGSVVILNSGHWSLHYVDIATYMSDMDELVS